MTTTTASLNPNLQQFWLDGITKGYRNLVLYGGRASSKTWDAAGFIVMLATQSKLRVLCCRQFQNKIEESVYTVLKTQIERFGLESHYRILDNKIICTTTGSEFIFYGLWRSMGQIRGLEGIDICWLEEAHLLEENQWLELEPTLRKDGSQFWIIFNPHLITDFIWKRFVVNPPPNTLIRKINYNENPFLSSTMLDVIESARQHDSELFAHIYDGEPLNDDDNSIIKRSHILAAIDAHKKLGIEIDGANRIGFDVADAGEDYCAMVECHGNLVRYAEQWRGKEDELLKSCTRVWTRARDSWATVTYDAIGVGSGVGAKLNELNAQSSIKVRHDKFFAGGSVMRPDAEYSNTRIKNKDFFSNIKSQAWWLIADRFRLTYAVMNGTAGHDYDASQLIFIDSNMPHLEQLIDELATPKRDYDNAGRVKVESKKDLKNRNIPSPNLADAFIMAVGCQVKVRSLADIYGE